MSSCAAFAAIISTREAPVDRDRVIAMSSRFPSAAFGESQFFFTPHGAFATAAMRTPSGLSTSCSSGSEDEVCVADARLEGLASFPSMAPTSDLLRALFSKDPETAPDRIRGDFSVVYWNDTERRLIAARDRFGMRPLYYATSAGEIALSNSIEALLVLPWVSREPRAEVVGSFVVEGNVRDAGTTFYRDIQRVLPGHYLRIGPAGPEMVRYWRMPIVMATRRRSIDEVSEEFRAGLRSAVERSFGYGPAAISLSGGMDSSAIAATAVAASQPVVAAFTVGHATGDDEERDLARETASRLGIEWVLADTFDVPLWKTSLDAGAPVSFPLGAPQFGRMIDFLRVVSKRSSVLISGEGGDELMWQPSFPFAGSLSREGVAGIVRDFVAARSAGLEPRFGIRNFMKRRRAAEQSLKPEWLRAPVAGDTAPQDEFASSIGIRDVERFEAWERLQSPMFMVMFESLHPCSTGVPVEYRWPYLDRELVELSLGLPGYPAFDSKALLRRSMSKSLPDGVLRRKKSGASDSVVERINAGEDPLPRFKGRADQSLFDTEGLFREARALRSVAFPRNWMALRALEVLLWRERVESL